MKKYLSGILIIIFTYNAGLAQDRWQQRIKYNIDVRMDVATNRFAGTEKIEYTNNSPDTLKRIFMHLYWNAFQPGSSMDVRSQLLGQTYLGKNKKNEDVYDWDARVKDRISKLKENEIGFQHVQSVTINGKQQQLKLHETILEIVLSEPILPKSKTLLDVAFESQVPLQIRRSGRDSEQGIRYSMSQWYPKVSAYDQSGWHPNPYVAREFYGVWGYYDVKITIDKNYTVAATGELQNANQVGHGYATTNVKPNIPGNTITWNFIGKNIHDFVWAADTAYKHLSKKIRPDLTLHVFYKNTGASADSAWNNVLWTAEKALPYMEKRFGKYPWPVYSFIHAGDGGMEYAMATLLKGPGLGTVIHEWMHSWYQHLMGTNESLYAWMDEGFTDYAENEVMYHYLKNFANSSPYISNATKADNTKKLQEIEDNIPHKQYETYDGYFRLQRSPYEEPMTTHADHFNTNYAYGLASYSKGSAFLTQLGYIVGDSVRDKILLEYYNQWKFKSPTADDFIRLAEKVSGIELDWYKEYWINSTKAIDYNIGDIKFENGKTRITVKKIGKMPMPVEVLLTFKDGTKELHYVPLNLMYGEKPVEDAIKRIVYPAWRWTHPEYIIETTRNLRDLKEINIDPSGRMADVNQTNNVLIIPD